MNKERHVRIVLLKKERENKRRKTRQKDITNIVFLMERSKKFLIAWWNLLEFSVAEVNILMLVELNRESFQSLSA